MLLDPDETKSAFPNITVLAAPTAPKALSAQFSAAAVQVHEVEEIKVEEIKVEEVKYHSMLQRYNYALHAIQIALGSVLANDIGGSEYDGILCMSLQDVLIELATRFGKLAPAQLIALMRRAKSVVVGPAGAQALRGVVPIYKTLSSHKQPVSDIEQLEAFEGQVANTAMREALVHAKSTGKTTLRTVVDAMILFLDNTEGIRMSQIPLVHANQTVARINDEVVTQGTIAAAVVAALTEIMPQLVIGQASNAKGTGPKPKPSKQRKSEVAADPHSYREYCFFHGGYNPHSGKQCNTMKRGKQFTDAMRAATTPCTIEGHVGARWGEREHNALKH